MRLRASGSSDLCPVLSKWGEKRIDTIKRGDCEDAIAAAKLRGDHAAVSVHMVLSAFFTWAEKRGDILKSPMKGLDKPAAESNSERDLTDEELKTIWAGCVALGNPHGALNQMLLLTGQRRTEVAAMKFSEIDFETREWHLGGKRVKNDNPHVVHLAPAAMAIIEAAPGSRIATTFLRRTAKAIARDSARPKPNSTSLRRLPNRGPCTTSAGWL